jgi:hypothetical protein
MNSDSNDKSIIDLVREDQDSPDEQGASKAPELNAGNFSNVPEDEGMKKALDGLLENITPRMVYSEFKLPSNGIFYKGVDSISIRPLTFADERVIRNTEKGADSTKVLDNVLKACTNGIDMDILTPQDRLFVLFKLREISYGDEYKLEQNCESCGVKNSLTLKLSTLEMSYLEDDYRTFTLPDSGKEVEIKVPSSASLKGLDTLDSIMENIHRFIVRIETVDDRLILQEFVKKTSVRDVDVLRNKIFLPDYGLEDSVVFNCMKCSQTTKCPVGINEYFFTSS